MKRLVLFSGGMDSATALYAAKHSLKHEVLAMFVDYRQRHMEREYSAAVELACGENSIPLRQIQVDSAPFAKNAITGGLPKDQMDIIAGPPTVVPHRNLLFLSYAAAVATAEGVEEIWFGPTRNDYAVYRDCRELFINQVKDIIFPIRIVTPYLHWDKSRVVESGMTMRVPYEKTYSCYRGGEKHCAVCGACIERQRAFWDAGVDDPTDYKR